MWHDTLPATARATQRQAWFTDYSLPLFAIAPTVRSDGDVGLSGGTIRSPCRGAGTMNMPLSSISNAFSATQSCRHALARARRGARHFYFATPLLARDSPA
jgi:hypothetical protein